MEVERIKLDFIKELGYVDTFRLFNNEPHQYTWWDVKTRSREKNVGWRIDYHWVTNDLVPYIKILIINQNKWALIIVPLL